MAPWSGEQGLGRDDIHKPTGYGDLVAVLTPLKMLRLGRARTAVCRLREPGPKPHGPVEPGPHQQRRVTNHPTYPRRGLVAENYQLNSSTNRSKFKTNDRWLVASIPGKANRVVKLLRGWRG
jgi:hypothetical protein